MKTENLIEEFKKQLPKGRKLSLFEIIGTIGSLCSMTALILSLFIVEQNTQSIIYTIFLVLLVFFLLIFTLNREFSKKHRYSQTLCYVHFINHIIRDKFAEIAEGKELGEIGDFVEDILSQISACFTLVTAKPCRVCLKELKPDKIIKTSRRCSLSQTTNTRPDRTEHQLDKNTDFYNLWYAKNGCLRYYMCNNLLKAWKVHKYMNTSFDKPEVGNPEIKTFIGYSYVSNWNLPYKSALVLPIRFLKRFSPPEKSDSKHPMEWKFWGFLCIDCNSRGVFHEDLAPELGLAFADLLYIFFDELKKKKGAIQHVQSA